MEQELERKEGLPSEQTVTAVEEFLAQKKKINWVLPVAIAAGAVLLTLAFVLSALFIHREQGADGETTTESASRPSQLMQPTQPPFPLNPYGPMDFQYEGDYLTCLAGESELGIDVSGFQGVIDWEKVRDAGVKFVMIRIGGRGYGKEGKLYEDGRAPENYAGAKAAGLRVGAYFFSQAISVEEAEEEAAYALEQIRDWELDMPVVYDWEYISEEARTANVDQRTLTDCTLAFCRAIEKAGKEAMVYFNPNQSENHIFLEELKDYRSWLAMYSDWMTYPYRVDMWQYTNAGTVPGIEGAVDINLYFPY